MKLLICVTEYYPHGSGIANVAYNVVEQLKKEGVECTVCSPTGPDIKINSLNGYGRLGLLHFWYKVGKYFQNKADEYDAVWLHYPLLFVKNPFNKCLITVHSTALGFLNENIKPVLYYKFAHKLEKYCLNKFVCNARFTGVSSKTCQELDIILKHHQPVTYILNGVDTTVFKPLASKELALNKFGIPLESKVLLSVGRLIDHKMPFVMLDTFNKVQKESNEKYKLVIAGKGNLFEPMNDYVAKNQIDNVIFLGYVSDEELPLLYACCDYFIITSKYEGGEPVLTVAEAMASGLPCIVSNISNFNFVNKANCGIVVDFKNLQKAGNEVISYLEKDNSEHSINARIYAENNFDWGIITEEYIKEFNKLDHV